MIDLRSISYWEIMAIGLKVIVLLTMCGVAISVFAQFVSEAISALKGQKKK